MRKNKILFGIILSLFILLPIGVNAGSTISLNGGSKAGPGNIVAYKIEIDTTSNAKNIKTELTYDSTVLELISIVNEEWSGNNKVGTSPKSLEFTSKGVSGKTIVSSLTFKVKESTTKTSTSIKLSGTTITVVGDEEELVETAGEATATIKISSTDADLSSLKINGESVSGFRAKTYNYNIVVDGAAESVTIKATTNNDNASFVNDYGPREEKLEYGPNKIELKVQAESGDIKTSTLNISG